MELDNKVRKFREIANALADLYEKKNHNYGDSFGKLYTDLGPIAGLVPLHNKLDRLTNLIKGDENHFESVEDNFKDLAAYAIMNLIEYKSYYNPEYEEPKIEDDHIPNCVKLSQDNWKLANSLKTFNDSQKKTITKDDLNSIFFNDWSKDPFRDLYEETLHNMTNEEYNKQIQEEIDKILEDMAEYSNEH